MQICNGAWTRVVIAELAEKLMQEGHVPTSQLISRTKRNRFVCESFFNLSVLISRKYGMTKLCHDLGDLAPKRPFCAQLLLLPWQRDTTLHECATQHSTWHARLCTERSSCTYASAHAREHATAIAPQQPVIRKTVKRPTHINPVPLSHRLHRSAGVTCVGAYTWRAVFAWTYL
jgi:hypothetical protein